MVCQALIPRHNKSARARAAEKFSLLHPSGGKNQQEFASHFAQLLEYLLLRVSPKRGVSLESPITVLQKVLCGSGLHVEMLFLSAI